MAQYDPNNESKAPELEDIDKDIDLLSASNTNTNTDTTTAPITNDILSNTVVNKDVLGDIDDEIEPELTAKIPYVIQNKYWAGNGKITGRVCAYYYYLYTQIYRYNLYLYIIHATLFALIIIN